MNNKQFILLIIVGAFLAGAAMAAGHKVMDYVWPDPPAQIEILEKTT